MEEYLNTSAGECRKNPGHKQFIPTALFKPIHLPERFRSQLVWAFIFHKARLTVRLIVNYVSRNRPAEFMEDYTNRITGSGYVTDIDKSNPGCVTITIDTAAHVVYDDDEAASTIAQFYFNRDKEIFQIGQAVLLIQGNPRRDMSRIKFTIDLETLQQLASPSDLSALEYALSPSIFPDVNNNISLLQSVILQSKITQIPWLKFLFREIKCLRNIKFFSHEIRLLEIEIQISHILLYDIILLITVLASHRDNLMQAMEDIVYRNDINMKKVQRPYITLLKEKTNGENIVTSASKLSLDQFIDTDNEPVSLINSEFTIYQNATLYQLMTCFSRSPVEIGELNTALTNFCRFDISARFRRSDVIVFEIPVRSVNVADKLSLEVTLHDIQIEDEQDNIAVLISHPHDMRQQITVGELKNEPGSREISYTTPSCPGSSGGQVQVIPRDPTSLEDLENINVITHSHASSVMGFGNRF